MKTLRLISLLMLTALIAAAETRVRIVGLEKRSEAQVMELIGGRLVHVLNSPAIPPLADDAAFLVRHVLEKDGFTDVRVDWAIAGPAEIVLTVDEGRRWSLGDVTVTGVEKDEAAEFARFFTRPAGVTNWLAGELPPFREEDVETGLSYLRQELNARGHWAPEVEITDRDVHAETGVVDLTIQVEPGLLYRIAEPTVKSTGAEGAELARVTAKPFVGKEATTGNLNAMRLAVEQAIIGSGFANAAILMTQTLEPGSFIAGFSIDLGNRFRLNEIHITGLKRTRPQNVRERLKGMEGEWYDEAAMSDRLRQFLTTGAFSAARIETTELDENTIDATLRFTEAKAREVTLAAGAGSYQGLITRAGYTDRNLFGRLMGFNVGVEMSFLGLLGDVRVTDPWLFGSDVSGTGRLYALTYSREGYDALETGLEGKLNWSYGEHYSLEVLAGYSLVNLSEDGLPVSELGETVYTHPRLRVTQKLDYRNSVVLPTRGWHLEAPVEIGAAIGDLSTPYASAKISGGWFHEINRHYNLGVGGELGILMPSGGGNDLPIDLRLFNGGSRSVRSFPDRELGPTVNGYPTGGEAMWNTNVELIRNLGETVKAVAFFDAGALARNHEELTSAEIELAVGLGLRLNLPIGPVRFEYGYNLTQDPGEPSGTFHFAIGFAY